MLGPSLLFFGPFNMVIGDRIRPPIWSLCALGPDSEKEDCRYKSSSSLRVLITLLIDIFLLGFSASSYSNTSIYPKVYHFAMALDSNNRLDHPLSAFDGDASRVHLRREYDIFHALHASETDLLIKHTGGHLRSIPSTVPQV